MKLNSIKMNQTEYEFVEQKWKYFFSMEENKPSRVYPIYIYKNTRTGMLVYQLEPELNPSGMIGLLMKFEMFDTEQQAIEGLRNRVKIETTQYLERIRIMSDKLKRVVFPGMRDLTDEEYNAIKTSIEKKFKNQPTPPNRK